MVQLMAVFISMRCTLCGHFLLVSLTLILAVGYSILSLHVALPICRAEVCPPRVIAGGVATKGTRILAPQDIIGRIHFAVAVRSEEHTSELQSRFDLVCRLLLEKKIWYS